MHKSKAFNPNKKMDMVLFQGFPANETLSAGAVKYMNEFFNIHFINLPGFHNNCPPLENLTFKKLCAQVENEIDNLGLEEYILAGISFGFLLVNNIKVDLNKVVAVLAIAPFLGVDYLQMHTVKQFNSKVLLDVSRNLRIQEIIWGRRTFKKFLAFMMGKKEMDMINTVIDECNPKSFFDTARMILSLQPKTKFRKLPHILLINKEDTAIDAKKTIEAFKNGVDKKLLDIVYTDMPHYPKDTSYEFFKKNFRAEDFEYVYDFIAKTRLQ